jgi:two-component system, OmpR family, sensor kinase
LNLRLFSTRLSLALLALSAISLAQGVLTVWVAARSQYHIEKGQVANKLLTEFIDLAGNKQRLKVWLAQHLLTNDSPVSVKQDLNAKMAASLKAIRVYLDKDLELSKGSLEEVRIILEQKERLKTLEININSLRAELERVKRSEVGADPGQIWKTLIDVFDNLQGSDLRRLIADAIQIQKIRAASADAAAKQSIEGFNIAIYILSALAVLTGAVLSIAMAGRLRRPIEELVDAAIAMKSGRLDHRIHTIENNEFGVLAEHLNEMADEIERGRQSDLEKKQQIEKQVEERTHELKLALEKLQKNEIERQLFVMNISHELRTPATAILGEVEVTLRDKNSTNEVFRETLQNISIIGKQLAHRVEDLLVLSQADRNDLRISVRPQMLSRLNDTLQEAIRLVDPRQSREIKLQDEVLTREQYFRVLFDRQRLGQLFVILIENAVRYSPRGSPIEVGLRANDSKLEVRISNLTLEQEEIDFQQLTERHYRSSVAKKVRPDGLGVGLNIAKVLVAAHGGELKFQSDRNRNFVVVFSLNLKGPENEDFGS